MKFKEFKRRLDIEEQYLKSWIYGTWSWNKNGSVDVLGHVYLQPIFKFDTLPFKFNKVTGDFNCACNGLKTLKNCPEEICKDFYCSNNLLKNLKYSPKIVNGNYNCMGNIASFSEEDVKEICKVNGHINTCY